MALVALGAAACGTSQAAIKFYRNVIFFAITIVPKVVEQAAPTNLITTLFFASDPTMWGQAHTDQMPPP